LSNLIRYGSLFIPLAVIANFHRGNRGLFGRFDGAFLDIPFRFLTRLEQFRIEFPDGLIAWTLGTLTLIVPTWFLGYGALSGTGLSKRSRVLTAFPIGLGMVGVILELLAMAGWFHKFPILSVYIAAAIGGFILTRRSGETGVCREVRVEPCGPFLRVGAWFLWGFIALLTFEHALFFPPTYHDALIYYLYYAKLTFLNGGIPFPVDSTGFPEFVQCQVGLGLGANYPHLFLLWQASIVTVFGQWSSIPGQFIPPLAGVATALLVYFIVRNRYQSERLALWSLLLVESAPYWIWYRNWVSDYPLAVWLTIASLALLAESRTFSKRGLVALVALACAGSHLNYLMVTLWIFPLIYWLGDRENRWTPAPLGILLFGLVFSSTWLVRNWVVTGNPVYAFFPEILGGVNIDLDVLRSCEVEWNANGDGFNKVGDTFISRLLGLPSYFLVYPALNMKWAALPVGWFLPGLLFLFRRSGWDKFRFALVTYTGFLFFYGLAISGMYLYHLMPLVPMMVLIAADWMSAFDRSNRWSARFHSLLILAAVFTIGLPAAIYGAKRINGSVTHTLHPGADPDGFLASSEFGPHYRMWRILNARLPEGAVILTHENRHYYLRDDLQFLHMDDYRLIPWYDRDPGEVVHRLQALGVNYYLRIPNEKNHPILGRLGIEAVLETYFTLLESSPDGRIQLYAFTPPSPRALP
jgi:hypothetical protein